VIRVDEDTLTLVAATPPKSTLVAPLRLVPLMVTLVPPAVGPDVGEMEVTVGAGTGGGATEVNWSALSVGLEPFGVVIVTSKVPAASAGATALIRVDEDTLKLDAGAVPKSTLVAPLKPVPLMVTLVPPVLGPLAGEMEVTVGAGGGGGVTDVNWSAATTALVPLAVVTVTSYTPAASAGAAAVMLVDEFTPNPVDGTEPKKTWLAPLKPVPFTVTTVPPVVGPDVGEREVIVGADPVGEASHVNVGVLTAGGLVPRGVPTRTSPLPLALGVVAVMVLSLTTTTLVATAPFVKYTTSAPVKPVPVMLIGVPPVAGPDTGESPVTVTGPTLAMGPESGPPEAGANDPGGDVHAGYRLVPPGATPNETQTVARTHETELRPVPVLAFPLVTRDQVVPSHCSTRFSEVVGPDAGVDVVWPTAVQPEGEAQETPLSWFRALAPAATVGFGLATMAQVLPSHCSTRV
jgi:hypothetical protein